MTEVIRAIYENGVLRPLEPLKLRERQTVCLQVVEEDQNLVETISSLESVIQHLTAEGLLRPHPSGPIPPDPVSPEKRKELAECLGNAPGKPLSEIIIEERGEW